MLRFASSPTGDMYIDNLRVALLNYLVSQQRNESFIIRIEDIDKARNIEGKDTEIMQILEKFALHHASVFHQSEHLHMHQTMAIKLLEQGKAFVCTCTEEILESDREKAKRDKVSYHYSGKCETKDTSEHAKLKEQGIPFVLRLKKPRENIIHHDLIQGEIITTPNEVDAFIILHADGTPSHDFASACDDMLSGIRMVIREDAYLSHTPKQIHIKKQLGFTEETQYAHVSMLEYPSSKQILKKDDTFSVKWLFQEGFIPDAIINYLLLLGHSQKVPKEIFTLPEALAWFKLEDISTSTVKFDIEKLRFINREHLKMMEDKQLSSLFGFADEAVGKLLKLYLEEEVSTINELALKIRPIFAPKTYKGAWGKEMKMIQNIIIDAPMIDTFSEFKSLMIHKSGLNDENLLPPLRLILTGATHGPALSDIYPLIKPYLLEIAS